MDLFITLLKKVVTSFLAKENILMWIGMWGIVGTIHLTQWFICQATFGMWYAFKVCAWMSDCIFTTILLIGSKNYLVFTNLESPSGNKHVYLLSLVCYITPKNYTRRWTLNIRHLIKSCTWSNMDRHSWRLFEQKALLLHSHARFSGRLIGTICTYIIISMRDPSQWETCSCFLFMLSQLPQRMVTGNDRGYSSLVIYGLFSSDISIRWSKLTAYHDFLHQNTN